MGLLTKLGDAVKSITNNLPGVGFISEGLFGEVGEQGLVGRIGGGGGITRASQPTIGTGQFPVRIPGGFGGTPAMPRNGSYFGGSNGNGSSNGQYSDDISTLLGGDRIVMEPQQKVINTAPPGWVVVDMPDGSGKKAVRKEVARCLGLWKARSKPPISASDWKKLKTAKRVENKAKKIAQTAGWKGLKKC